MNMIDRRTARSVADVTKGTIIATVDIAAPPDRVFRALTSSEIANWWGAEGVYRTTAWSGTLEVGGRWKASGVGADGKSFAVEGEYLEIDPPRTLVYTWKPDWDAGKATTVTYRLQAIDGGTRLTLRHEGFDSAESCANHTDGWATVLGWLRAFVTPATPRAFFCIRLLPPRPTFTTNMSEAERRVMGEHVTYWKGLLDQGTAIAFGPVADPKGPWGVGIVEVEDAAATKTLEANDPAIKSGLGFRYEILPMPQAMARGR